VFERITAMALFVLRSSLMGLGVALLFIVASGRSGILFNDSASSHPTFADAVERAAPMVVSVHTASARERAANPLLDDPLFQRFFRLPAPTRPETETSLGSGVVVGDDGMILTNYHVVAAADRIQVVLHDGRVTEARLIGSDPDTDIAVLQIEQRDLTGITIADSNRVRIGDVVLAIGNPLGVGQTVTQGIISATGRNRVGINTFENFIQTDAAINPGNSGGALVNADGELIGINAAILGYPGISFAIPTSIAIDVMQQLIRHGRVRRGWIGVDARDLSPSLRRELKAAAGGAGIAVLAVMPAGPAAIAGFQPGDIITRIGEHEIRDSQTAFEVIAGMRPGSVVRIEGLRMGAPIAYATAVAARPVYASR
jgi:serine protease DegS